MKKILEFAEKLESLKYGKIIFIIVAVVVIGLFAAFLIIVVAIIIRTKSAKELIESIGDFLALIGIGRSTGVLVNINSSLNKIEKYLNSDKIGKNERIK